ncbi:MAG: hypothetical protein KME47_10400 [Nodosilinea sp. WJT8-NPBG4]|jgi:hypothetical protein|nr:hypothetical protein [Nodosilinea sp. WJT8-NPBG4]
MTKTEAIQALKTVNFVVDADGNRIAAQLTMAAWETLMHWAKETLEIPEASDPGDGLANLVGAAPGSFESPEDVDAFVRRERDSWAY